MGSIRLTRTLPLLAVAAVLAIGLIDAGAAQASPPRAATCSGGSLGSGTYRGVTVTGSCTIPDGAVVTIRGQLRLAPGAQLNAVTASTVHVDGNVLVERGALLGFGCSLGMTIPPFPGGPVFCSGVSHDVVDGSIVADRPLTMYLDGLTVHGNVISVGGGMPVTGPDPAGCEERPGALNLPIKDNKIDGTVLVTGWRGCWFGYIRNQQGGTAVLVGNHTASSDSSEIVTNTIRGNLICLANSPAPQLGDSGGTPNTVHGHKIGQCATL